VPSLEYWKGNSKFLSNFFVIFLVKGYQLGRHTYFIKITNADAKRMALP
jgi:hypothetical protein